MAYTAITKILQGYNVPKSVIDALIDNDEYFFNLLSNSGSASGSIVNGSFEGGSGADAPSGWIRAHYSGGSSGYYSPGVHGSQAFKFTSAGTGGGNLTSEDYYSCSPKFPVALLFFLVSTVATVRNVVSLLWYDENKLACSTPSTNIYDDDTTNPTTAVAWGGFIRSAVPPSDARYFRVWLCGCHSSDATAGTTYFDGIDIVGFDEVTPSGAIAENNTIVTSFADEGSMTITLPPLSASSIVELSIVAQCRIVSASATATQRFRVGTQYSDSLGTASTSYVYQGFNLLLYGATGAITLYQQLMTSDSDYAAYGKTDAYSVVARIIKP